MESGFDGRDDHRPPGWRRVIPFRWIFDASGSPVRYVLLAWPLATMPMLVVLPVISAVAHRVGVPVPSLGLTPLLIALAIGLAPWLETLIMFILNFALRKVVRLSESPRVFVLALAMALTHASNGLWVRPLFVLWPFYVYSAALVSWQRRSNGTAFWIVTALHGLGNLTVVTLVLMTES
jgi:hypothetical protein